MMDEHDRYTQELFENKSLDALIWLIDAGRELEFTCGGQKWFITCCNSRDYVSLCCNGTAQSFSSVSDLIENALLQDLPFSVAWQDAELQYLF